MRPHLHVRDLEGDRLVGTDRAAEGDPGVRVGDRLVEAALRQSDGERRDRDPALVEDPQELREPLAARRRAGSPPAPARPSNASSCVSEAFQPTLEYFGATVSPGVPAGTMIVEISLRPRVVRRR